MRKAVVVLVAALVGTVVAWTGEAAAQDLGPAVGARAPEIGAPLDQTGKPRALESLMGDKGLVLFFFRSTVWWPYCQAQLVELQSGASEIEKRGYRLAGICYEPPEALASFVARRNIAYTLLSDPKSEVIDRYGLRDPAYKPGSRAYGVPRPIILFIERDGLIKGKLFEETFQKRPPLGLVIETLDKLVTTRP
jgi:peroxiredoxin